MDPGTAQLIKAARAGDRNAFVALVERFQGPVFALAYSYLRDGHDAEDVAQEAFVRAYTALSRLKEPERFPSWLSGITAHVAVDRLRERRLTAGTVADPWQWPSVSRPVAPAEAVAREERLRQLSAGIEAALAELPEDARRAVLLRFFNGMSYAEIAEFTSVPVTTVRGQLYRATRHLRERLRRLWEEPQGGV